MNQTPKQQIVQAAKVALRIAEDTHRLALAEYAGRMAGAKAWNAYEGTPDIGAGLQNPYCVVPEIMTNNEYHIIKVSALRKTYQFALDLEG